MTTEMLNAALDYAANGWYVFPCTNKIPKTRNGFKDATIDPDQITKWWTKWPDANIGIATGHTSNLLVIDIDIKPSKNGLEELNSLTKLHGPLPNTPRVRTGSGGLHIYFNMPDQPIKSSASKLAPAIDIRADGGYVIAPPSSHASGQKYEWIL